MNKADIEKRLLEMAERMTLIYDKAAQLLNQLNYFFEAIGSDTEIVVFKKKDKEQK
ncbi:MAG: hypothetical protein ACFFDN_19905 [Candidatus Hodarchaeota archaeon]